jgi:putative methyltransferase
MGGLNRKFSFRSIERVTQEFEWCGKNEIVYVFNADSNFGQHNRDMEIVDALIKTKEKFGYPEKFRTCYGKNTDDKIYQIARKMFENGLEKGITLSRQSNDKEVLKTIKRGNIKMSTYMNLQKQFNEANIPVYSELILGLPGETCDTWRNGIEDLLQAGLKNQLYVYLCQVFPNTELADNEYRKKHGIITQRIELNELHGSFRKPGVTVEYEDIIVTTRTMPLSEWKRMAVLSLSTMMFHSLKLAFFLLMYLANRFETKYTDFLSFISEREMPRGKAPLIHSEMQYFHDYIERITQGKGRGVVMPEYGEISWDVEEASFLRISENMDTFYDELYEIIVCFLKTKKINFNKEEVKEAAYYQKCRIPQLTAPQEREEFFQYNFPHYFETLLSDFPEPLTPQPQSIMVKQKDFQGNKQVFARELILWGRKSGTNLTDIQILPDTCEV